MAESEEMMRAIGTYKSVVMLENTAAFVLKVPCFRRTVQEWTVGHEYTGLIFFVHISESILTSISRFFSGPLAGG